MKGKRLYKSADKKFCGVCGGIADYLGIDHDVVRVVFAVLFITTGSSVLLPYIIAAIIMDDAPEKYADRTECIDEKYRPDDIVYDSSEPAGFAPGYDDGSEIKGFKI